MVDTIKFSEFTDGGELDPTETIVGLDGTNAKFTTFPNLSPGTTGDRPVVDPKIYYRLRFNTTLESYEYYSPTYGWIQLEDSIDVQTFPFVIYQPEPLLPNAFDLGTLTSGMLKQTVAAGVSTPSIAVNGTDYYGPGFSGYLQAPVGVEDAFGNIAIDWTSVGASAVNYPQLINSATSVSVKYTAEGADSDIDVELFPKGAGQAIIDGLNWPTSDGPANSLLSTDGAAQLDFTSITAGPGITVTTGPNIIQISTSGGGLPWIGVSGTTQACDVNHGYITQNAGLTTYTLPAIAAIGDTVRIQGLGAGGWVLTANTGQTIQVGSSATSSGGTVASTNRYDCIEVVCIVADTTWAMTPNVSAGFTIA